MVEMILGHLKNSFQVSERPTANYSTIKLKGKTFGIKSWEIAGIGRLSTVTMSAMLGLMKMETAVLTPLWVDAPLYSCDVVDVMGKKTLINELYDTLIEPWDESAIKKVKERASSIPDYDVGTHWYDGIKLSCSLAKRAVGMDADMDMLMREYFLTYITRLKSSPDCSKTVKQQKTAAYVNGLLENGGPAADQFKKLLGEEKTRELLTTYIFSCAD